MKRTSVFSGIFLGTRLGSLAVQFAGAVLVLVAALVIPAVAMPAAFVATGRLGQVAAPGVTASNVTAPNVTESSAAQSNAAGSHVAAPTSTASNSATPGAAASSAQYSVQGTVASAQGAPVSYASVTQVNGLLTQLETTSKTAQGDLTNLRIERWKTDAGTKKQALGNVDSILRNLQNALPAIVEKLRAAPEDVPATFNLYRNLDALYDVVEETGAFGSKDDFQALANDLKSFEGTRKALAERLENLATAKEAEIVRLRSDLKTAQAAIPVAPPKKIVVDDNEPAKKPPVKKKLAAKPGAKPAAKPAGTSTTTKPAAGQTQTPATPQTPAPKPQ
jgi:hypothetical protein